MLQNITCHESLHNQAQVVDALQHQIEAIEICVLQHPSHDGLQALCPDTLPDHLHLTLLARVADQAHLAVGVTEDTDLVQGLADLVQGLADLVRGHADLILRHTEVALTHQVVLHFTIAVHHMAHGAGGRDLMLEGNVDIANLQTGVHQGLGQDHLEDHSHVQDHPAQLSHTDHVVVVLFKLDLLLLALVMLDLLLLALVMLDLLLLALQELCQLVQHALDRLHLPYQIDLTVLQDLIEQADLLVQPDRIGPVVHQAPAVHCHLTQNQNQVLRIGVLLVVTYLEAQVMEADILVKIELVKNKNMKTWCDGVKHT